MRYAKNEEDLIILDCFEELTKRSKELLLENGGVDFAQNSALLIKTLSAGVYNKIRERFFDEKFRAGVLDELEKKGIACLTSVSKKYPERLKDMSEPPTVLYCKGNTALLENRCVGIVGSRRSLPNILKECVKITGELTKSFTIVTGMADGGDSAAIEGALPSGKIISVLAYGFDYCYPAMNRALTDKVIEKGLIISEHRPTVSPKRYLFPQRNKLIAALAEGVFVISAGKKSGALITAECAFEYNRKVLAFPYAPYSATGEGCNGLIKAGAALVESAEDIYRVLGTEYKKPSADVELKPDEQAALNIISAAGEAYIDDIAAKMGKQPYQILVALSSLELKGLAVRLGGNRYAAL